MSYSDVAIKAGFPNAARAVGTLMKQNKDSNIPCHRVICKNGDIGNYNLGRKEKAKRLKKEGYNLYSVNSSLNE